MDKFQELKNKEVKIMMVFVIVFLAAGFILVKRLKPFMEY